MQVAMLGKAPEVVTFISFQTTPDLSLAGIIACNGQMPVTELSIKVGEKGNGSLSGLFSVTPLIHVVIYFKVIKFTGSLDELPETHGFCP